MSSTTSTVPTRTPRQVTEAAHQSVIAVLDALDAFHYLACPRVPFPAPPSAQFASVWFDYTNALVTAQRLVPEAEPYLNVGGGVVEWSPVDRTDDAHLSIVPRHREANYHASAVFYGGSYLTLISEATGAFLREMMAELVWFPDGDPGCPEPTWEYLCQRRQARGVEGSDRDLAEKAFHAKPAAVKQVFDVYPLQHDLRPLVVAEFRDAIGRLPPETAAPAKRGGAPKSPVKERAIVMVCEMFKAKRPPTAKETRARINNELGTDYGDDAIKVFRREARRRLGM